MRGHFWLRVISVTLPCQDLTQGGGLRYTRVVPLSKKGTVCDVGHMSRRDGKVTTRQDTRYLDLTQHSDFERMPPVVDFCSGLATRRARTLKPEQSEHRPHLAANACA